MRRPSSHRLMLALLTVCAACGSKDAPAPTDTVDSGTVDVQQDVSDGLAQDTPTTVDVTIDAAPLPDAATTASMDAVAGPGADAATPDTVAADAGSADTAGAKCDPKTAGLHQAKYTIADHAETYAIARLKDGYALAGVAEVKGGFDGLLIRTDDSGKELWNKTLGGDGLELLYGVVALASGDLVVAGSSDSINGKSDLAWVVRLSPKGDLVWQSSLGAPDKASALGIAKVGDNLAVAGWREATGRDGLLAVVDDSGKALSMVSDGAKGDSELAAVVVDSAGIAAVGRRYGSDASAPGAWLWRLDAKGKPLESHVFAAPAMGGVGAEAHAVASVAGGGWVIGGLGPDKKGKSTVGWVLRADKAGKALWSRSFDDVPRVLGVAVTGKTIIGVGHYKTDGVVVASWLRAGLDGSLSGTAPALATQARLHALALVDDKRVAATGSLDGDKLTSAWLRVATGWGDAHCDNAGACAAMQLDDCLDKDPCTRDWCTIGTCDHGPLAKCP